MTDLKYDSRSIHRDSKRTRDAVSKWSHGARPSPGCYLNLITMTVAGGSESQRAKARPHGRQRIDRDKRHRKQTRRYNFREKRRYPTSISEGILDARESEYSNTDTMISGTFQALPTTTTDDNGRSESTFTSTEGPHQQPIDLGTYVRGVSALDTEKLVRKEYEILDSEGDVLRGRKARAMLRGQLGVEAVVEVEDDFELV